MKPNQKSLPNRNSILRGLDSDIKVKPWLIAAFFGSTLLVSGVVLLTLSFVGSDLKDSILRSVGDLSLSSTILIGLLLIILGSLLASVGFRKANISSITADSLHARVKGPRIVAIGGGTGMAALLSGLKQYSDQITAIITVADDGGSSGRLRRELGIPPPGDFRKCIAALADDQEYITKLLQYRFGQHNHGSDPETREISGHSFGNLLIAAMAGISGSFEDALEQANQLLAISGRVLPSTLADVTLIAEVQKTDINNQKSEQVGKPSQDSKVQLVSGESAIPKSDGTINRVLLEPQSPPVYPEAARAVLASDLVLIGPGSVYTSLLPNLLVPGLHKALAAISSPVVYVCNVATQPGETDGYSALDHLAALERHIGSSIIDILLVNNQFPELGTDQNTVYVELDSFSHKKVIECDLVDANIPWRHDPDKLARKVIDIYSHHKEKES